MGFAVEVSGEVLGEFGGVVCLWVDGFGLALVEDVDEEEQGSVFLFLCAGGGVFDCSGEVASSVDLEGLFSFADLPSELLPCPVAGDVGGVGILGEDQQDVVQAVGVE